MAHVAPVDTREAAVRVIYDGRQLYLACHTANPGPKGAHEVSGRPYARQPITWREEGPIRTTAEDIRFVMPDTDSPTWLGIWDAPTGGRLVSANDTPLPTDERGNPVPHIPDRDTYRVPAGSVSVSVV